VLVSLMMPAETTEGARMTVPAWWARGLLFENCNCQLLCPGHLSFKQLCSHERCLGIWALAFEEGRFEETPLDGLNAAVLFDSPQHMIAGNWTTALLVDARADQRQREAIEAILDGRAGGPWAVLGRFVGKRLDSQALPIHLEDEGRRKRMWADGLFDTSIEAIRGKDKTQEAALSNVFNQIHAPTQVLALGRTRCTDRRLAFSTEDTHALYSKFSWKAP
jgi:hypothetical protein